LPAGGFLDFFVPAGPALPAATPLASQAPMPASYEARASAEETLQTDSALKRWRMAANIDPEFALAHLFLSYATPDPAEGQTERQKAKFLARDVTPGEQLLIAWFDGVRENDYLRGIAAMNDLVQQYPKDKHILVWAGAGCSIKRNTSWRRSGSNRRLRSLLTSPPR